MKKTAIYLSVFLTAAFMFSSCSFSLKNFISKSAEENSSEITEINSENNNSTESVNAEKYLKKIGKIDKKLNASSDAFMTEKEAVKFFSDRGFMNISVESHYTADGQYYDSAAVSANSDEKHPVYEIYYVSSSGACWNISVINNEIYADPYLYNYQKNLTSPLLLSESAYMTSYDNVTNQYFQLTPNSSEISLKTVSKIDRSFIDGLSEEGIGGL